MENQTKVLYRADWENVNYDAETWDQQVIKIKYDEFPVIKETDKTYTIRIDKWNKARYGSTSIVLKDQSGKRFAYATKERALSAMLKRRKSYRQRLLNWMDVNNQLIVLIEQELKNKSVS